MDRRRLVLLGIVALAPLLVAARDPRTDLVACRGGEPASGRGLDIVSARGELIERATALRFVVRFAEDPPASGPGGRAWRVDFVLKDPRKPTFSFGPYRDVNRIIRYDNTDPPKASIILLAEQGLSQPSTFILEGRNLLITIAGRQLEVEGEDLEPAPLRPIRWNVVARFGSTCDHLGDGEATFRLTKGVPVVPPDATTATPSASSGPTEPTKGDPWLPLAVVVFVAMMLGAFLVARRSNIEDRTAPEPVSVPDAAPESQPYVDDDLGP